MVPKRMVAVLRDVQQLTSNIKKFTLSLPEQLQFVPGQYVSIRSPGMKRYHAFSIASSPLQQDTVELVVKVEGEYTTKMFSMQPGESFELMGPMGRFMSDIAGPTVMIAGGVGVTPFLSLLRGHVQHETWLFYSCRTRQDIIAAEELQKLQNNVHVVITLTREQPENWQGELGHIDATMLARHLSSLAEKDYYTCGPGRMVTAVHDLLRAAGVDEQHIHTESWG